MATLYVMSGAPGSGKSTFAKELLTKFQSEGHPATILSSDEIRLEVTGSYNQFTKEGEKLLWKTLLDRAQTASVVYECVIIDSTALTNKKRMFYWNNLHEFYEHFILVMFDSTPERCIANDAKRDRHVPEDAIEFMCGCFQEPNQEVNSHYSTVIRHHPEESTL